MDPYVITRRGAVASGGDGGYKVTLQISQGGATAFRVGISLTGTAVACGFHEVPPDQIEKILLGAGLDELEQAIRAGSFPVSDTNNIEYVFNSDRLDQLYLTRDREKACLWQERQPHGYFCKATLWGKDDRTTAPLCAACSIPDARTICSHLMHPSVTAVSTMIGVVKRACGQNPLCNIGNSPEDGSKCRIGGLECWQRVVDSSPAIGEPPPDVADRAADEIDYFGLVYRDRYESHRVWAIPQARSIGSLFGVCADANDFQHRVAALSDLLGKLDPYEQLGEEERLDQAGKRVGSLVALERLMERDHPEAVGAVKILRSISDARNAFPIHTRSEKLLNALRTLGVAYPASDWQLAWLQVLTAFWSSIRDIRIALQAAGSES